MNHIAKIMALSFLVSGQTYTMGQYLTWIPMVGSYFKVTSKQPEIKVTQKQSAVSPHPKGSIPYIQAENDRIMKIAFPNKEDNILFDANEKKFRFIKQREPAPECEQKELGIAFSDGY